MKHKVTDKWYVVQILNGKGEWIDLLDADFTRKEASHEIIAMNCGGHKSRMVERIAAFQVVREKDFTHK